MRDTRLIWRIQLLLLGVRSHHIVAEKREKKAPTTTPPQYNYNTMGLDIDFMFIRVLRFNLFDPVQSTGIRRLLCVSLVLFRTKEKTNERKTFSKFKRYIIKIAWLCSLIDYQLRLSFCLYLVLNEEMHGVFYRTI